MHKYGHHLNGRNEFAADTGQRTPDGKIIWRKLYQTTDTSTRRHPKIRGAANPFALSWRACFEDRAFFKKFGIHRKEAGVQTVQ